MFKFSTGLHVEFIACYELSNDLVSFIYKAAETVEGGKLVIVILAGILVFTNIVNCLIYFFIVS